MNISWNRNGLTAKNREVISMEKFKVSFTADNQQLKAIGTKHASDTYADIEATFTLGERWTDMDTVSAVWWNDYTRIATVLDSEGKCTVPYEVLTRKGCVRVNLVGSVVEDGELVTRLTSYSAEAVHVNEKIKLTGNEPQTITPSQYEQFVENVKADADRAESAKESAQDASASAQGYAQTASASASSASESATLAEQAKQSARASAQNAQISAQTAENAKDDAELARDEILGMRAEAVTLPEGSEATASYADGLLSLGIPRGDTGATGAKGDKGDTGATPNLTIGNVETLEPTESATATITGTAENPVLNLGIPQGDTGEVSLADLSTLLPTDTASGDIASFPDGQSVIPLLSLIADIEPIQYLNGYDKPWSGGNGKNKLQVTAETQTISGVTFTVHDDGTVTVNGTATDTAVFSVNANMVAEWSNYAQGDYVLNGSPTNQDTSKYKLRVFYASNDYIDAGSGVTWTFRGTSGVAVFKTDIVVYSGTTMSNVLFKPMIRLASETDSSFAPYSNICPIDGHTEVVTQRTGKNLWGGLTMANDMHDAVNNESACNFGSDDYGNYITLSASAAINYIPLSVNVTFKENTRYTIILKGKKNNANGSSNVVFRYTDGSLSYISFPSPTADIRQTLVVTSASGKTIKSVNGSWASGTSYLYYDECGVFEGVLTADQFEPYQGTTYTTSLGQTVYGGTLDVVSGELTITDGYIASYNGEALPSTWISDRDVYASGTTPSIGAEVVYKLASPQTIQLTPQEVYALLGENNVWADSGAVEVVYNADVTKWVEKKLS